MYSAWYQANSGVEPVLLKSGLPYATAEAVARASLRSTRGVITAINTDDKTGKQVTVLCRDLPDTDDGGLLAEDEPLAFVAEDRR